MNGQNPRFESPELPPLNERIVPSYSDLKNEVIEHLNGSLSPQSIGYAEKMFELIEKFQMEDDATETYSRIYGNPHQRLFSCACKLDTFPKIN